MKMLVNTTSRQLGDAALAVVFVFCAILAFAQPAVARVMSEAEASGRFATDASEHRMHAARLGSSRGPAVEESVRRWNEGAPASARRVASALAGNGFKPRTGVLFYAPQPESMRIYLITSGGIRRAVATDTGRDELSLASHRFRQSLGVDGLAAARAPHLRDLPPFVGRERQEFDADLALLSEILLPAEMRTYVASVEHLVIVADGMIASTPFAALSVGEGELLIDHATISIAPGLYDLSRQVSPWRGDEAFGNPLLVGDPQVPENTPWNVPALPGAEAEVRALAERLGIAPLIGSEATKQVVAERAQQATTIYIAAHGVADPANPLTGGMLMLSGDDAQSAFWTAAEIQERRLPASLAVLSACQTGLGRNMEGGVVGLTRAFHLAGVPRVVMSLWSVDDVATGFLMDRFSHYAMTEDPAAALRLAMLDARQVNDDPALWASFSVFGTAR